MHQIKSFSKKGNEKLVKIAKVAAKLFNRKGYLETNMNHISEAAKISKGGIYHYFSSKDEILYFILSNYMDVILEGLEKELKEIEDSASRIRFIISRHIRLYTQNLSEAKTLLHDASCLPKRHFKVIAEKERKYFQIVSEALQEIFQNPIPKDKLTTITFLLFGMCNWIYSWYDPKGSVPPHELSTLIYEIFIGSVGRLDDLICNSHSGFQRTSESFMSEI
jgi:AcrR family transcriptional regulator